MNNLEDLWDGYPGSEPPIRALLAEGRRQGRARRRRQMLRPLLAGTTVAALAGAFVLGTRAGHQDGTPTYAAPVFRTSAFRASLHPAASCEQLLDSYRTRGLAQVGTFGWNSYAAFDAEHAVAGAVAAAGARNAAGTATGSSTQGAVGNSATGTNVQEAGVDEPDDVKTNGSLIVRVHDATLSVYDASGATVRRIARLALPDLADAEILLSGHTVVAIGTDTAPSGRGGVGLRSRVETVSLADAAHPRIASDVAYSGSVTSARQHGSVVRLVIAADPPALDFVQPHRGLTDSQALAQNRDVVRRSTLSDWMPTYDDGTGSRPLLDCDRVAIPPAGLPLGTVGIVGFDAAAPTALDAIGIAGRTGIAYESTDHLYLTSTPALQGCPCPMMVHGGTAGLPGRSVAVCCGIRDQRTTIFQFDLAGRRAIHVATGEVTGTIADRWSMDEAGGVLRVAVTHLDTAGPDRAVQSSSVITMRPDGTRLVQDGRLDGLGVNETLTAARWFDDVAILSTARHTDPLFSVDLSDPAHPRLVGALHIPGYTTYFHPIGGGLLIGVGQKVAFDSRGEQERAEVALFDVADLAHARRLHVRPLRQWTWPLAGDDPRAFTWLPDRSTAITTFRTDTNALLLGVYHVDGGHLTEQLRTLPGAASTTPRTFELSDGRVVLAVGDRLEFLRL